MFSRKIKKYALITFAVLTVPVIPAAIFAPSEPTPASAQQNPPTTALNERSAADKAAATAAKQAEADKAAATAAKQAEADKAAATAAKQAEAKQAAAVAAKEAAADRAAAAAKRAAAKRAAAKRAAAKRAAAKRAAAKRAAAKRAAAKRAAAKRAAAKRAAAGITHSFYEQMDNKAIALEEAIHAVQNEQPGAISQVSDLRSRILRQNNSRLLAGGTTSVGTNMLLSIATAARTAARNGDLPALAAARSDIWDARHKLVAEVMG